MATLFQKYAALKVRIGGNRELHGYEETFGMPREEQQHITPVPRYIVRILSEVEFSIPDTAHTDTVIELSTPR